MMNQTEVQKLKAKAPLPLIIAAVLYLAPSFLVAPQLEELAGAESSYDVLLKNAVDALKQRKEISLMNEKYAELSSNTEALNAWLPPESDLPALIDRISEIASQLGIELSMVKYENDREIDSVLPPKIMIRFNIKADYAEVRAFLQAVKAVAMPLLITDVAASENGNFSISLMELVKP